MAQVHWIKNAGDASPLVFFLHGLGGDHKGTWASSSEVSSSGSLLDWLAEEAKCSVASVQYDAALSRWSERAMPLPAQANQVADLISSATDRCERPIVLVGHSMGGLVIKTMLVNCANGGDPRLARLLARVRGLAFIATPHAGSQLASLAKTLAPLLRTNDQVRNLALHDDHLLELNQHFQALFAREQFLVRVYRERLGVPFYLPWVGWQVPFLSRVVVDARSSDPSLPGVACIDLDRNHVDIAKPVDRQDQLFLSLCSLIREVQRSVGIELAHPTHVVHETIRDPDPIDQPAPSAVQPGRLSSHHDNRLQPSDSRFFGRLEEVKAIKAFLLGGAGVAPALEIVGPPGIGKTEVCKAALRAAMQANASLTVFIVKVPERATPAHLLSALGKAAGYPSDDPAALIRGLVPAIYYLDNFDRLGSSEEGRWIIDAMLERPGLRVLASSRENNRQLFGPGLRLGILSEDHAARLFRELWTGVERLENEEAVRTFVVSELGCHALTIVLVARLGDCYSFESLVSLWQLRGTPLARYGSGEDRLSSLELSLQLSVEVVARSEGALAVLLSVALFDDGLADEDLATIEKFAGRSDARRALVSQNLIERRGGRWHMLPPLRRFVARVARDSSFGFDWDRDASPSRSLIAERLAKLEADMKDVQAQMSRWVIDEFGAISGLIGLELSSAPNTVARQWIKDSHARMWNLYQYVPGLAETILDRLVSDFPDLRDAKVPLANIKARKGKMEEAMSLLASAEREAELGSFSMGRILKSRADLESHLGRIDSARSSYASAKGIFEKLGAGGRHGLTNVLRAMGEMESRVGDRTKAEGLLLEAMRAYEALGDNLGEANCLRSLGDMAAEAGETAEAKAAFNRALTLYARLEQGTGRANVLRSLGSLSIRTGDVDEAERYLRDAIEVYQSFENLQGQANATLELATVCEIRGDAEGSKRLAEESLGLYERIHDGLGKANVLRHLGNQLLNVDVGAAAECFSSARDLYASEHVRSGMADCIQGLGDCLSRSGDAGAAIEHYVAAVEIYRELPESKMLGACLFDLGACCLTLGAEEAGERHLKEAADILTRLDPANSKELMQRVLADLKSAIRRSE